MRSLVSLNRFGSAMAQIDIKGVDNGVIQLSNYRFRSVIEASSLNFELMSESERDRTIDLYGSFLNSLSIPIQILIRTRELDLDSYLEILEERKKTENNKIYKIQLTNYSEYIKSIVEENKILSRKFYIIVSFNATKKTSIQLAKEQLDLSISIIEKGLAGIGIVCRPLNSLSILELFYSFYNPSASKYQPLNEDNL